MTRVLVVDDEQALLRALRVILITAGYEVDLAATGREALQAAVRALPDIVVLDLGLPDLDGVEVIHGLRGWTDVPIIVLSGRDQGRDKVTALDAGADDYVTKPFGMDELLARLRAVARRRGATGAGDAPVVVFGDVRIDLVAKEVVRRSTDGPDEPVHLTPTEWQLLEVLVRSPGRLLGQRHLLTAVWGPAYAEAPANLRLYMSQLRRKLEPNPARPRFLVTEPGMGYRFRPDA